MALLLKYTRLTGCLIIVLACLLLSTASSAGAQTGFIGAKAWFTTWDSGILDWLEKDLAVSFEENRLRFTAHKDPGQGYMAGPLIGAMSDDGKWSFSLAPMFFSDFEQTWSGSAGTMTLNGEAELSRFDLDMAVSYAMNKNYKFFVGYKMQFMKLDFNLSYDTTMGTSMYTYKIDAEAHIPTVGIGAAYALNNKTVAGGQVGLLYSFMNLHVTDQSGATEDIWPHPGVGFNGEANLTYKPYRHGFVQLGYRYQIFVIDARGPGRDEKTRSYDITYGPTLAVVLMF